MTTYPGKHWGPNYFKNKRRRDKRNAFLEADTAKVEQHCTADLAEHLPAIIGAAVKACHANDLDAIEASKVELRKALEAAGVEV